MICVFGLTSCARRSYTRPNSDYVQSMDVQPTGTVFHLKKQYPGYHGFGMCGNWVSYSSGYADYTLIAPASVGHFGLPVIKYGDKDGISIGGSEYYDGGVDIDEKQVVILLINRKTGETYRRDVYTNAKVPPDIDFEVQQ